MNSTPEASTSSAATLPRWLNRQFLMSVLGPFLALGAVVLLFTGLDALKDGPDTFWTSDNFRTIAVSTATVAVAALGMTVVIIAGGIDLSAGTAIALCATVLAWGLKEDIGSFAHGDSLDEAVKSYQKAESSLNPPYKALLQELAKAEAKVRAKAKAEAAVEAEALGEAIVLGNAERIGDALVDAVTESEAKAEEAARENLRVIIAQHDEKLAPYRARVRYCRNWTCLFALLAAIGTGCLCGLFNGLLVSVLRVVPFIVTLGTMMVYLGLAKMLADETTVRPGPMASPEWLQDFTSLLQRALMGRDLPGGGLPMGVWLAGLMAILLAVVLRYSVFGRHIFALGSNESTARLCGISVLRTKVLVYAFAGLFVGLAGLYQFSRMTVGNPTSGSGLELKIIAAVVIGGASLNGGRGSVIGTLSGAAIMAVITNGCTQLEIKNPVQDIILGVIIIAAVFVDQCRQGHVHWLFSSRRARG